MTEAEFAAWLLDDDAIRTVLVEVDVLTGGLETTRFLSNQAYHTMSGDTPANTFYQDIITGGMDFTESITVDGSFNINYGDIELDNTNGLIDSWMDDIWENRDISVFVGDLRWPRGDFKLVFSGVTAGIDVRDRSSLNLKLADKLQRLNTTLSETKLGGTSSNADKLIPITIGEPHNVTPLLTDAVYLEYAVHTSGVEQITEVRDNGVPVSFTDQLDGTFRLTNSPYGTITASAQGAKSVTLGGYISDAATAIRYIAQELISADKRFDVSEVDVDSFDAISVEYPLPVGVYLDAKTNALQLCNSLAQGIGCRLTCTREGKLKLVKFTPVRIDVGTEVSSSDMLERSIEVSSFVDAVAAVKLGYAKNYTVQSSLTSGIPAAHIEMYAQEWWTVSRTDSAVVADYKLNAEVDMVETYLVSEAGAIVVADELLGWMSARRKVISYEGFPNLLTERLGDTQTIYHSRFGLSGGVSGQIISITTNWLTSRVNISVII